MTLSYKNSNGFLTDLESREIFITTYSGSYRSMAHFALLWKARTIEKYRLNYENEKINSITLANVVAPRKSLYQKFTKYQCDAKKRMSKAYKRCIPEGSQFSKFLLYLRTDQTFPNFVLKSVLGFVGGTVMTYLFFMFFVFQLAISLMHATIMSSFIGVLLTLGLAFSYRVRCLVFLLIPQLFSRVGRYTLTCYALVLILTGPATNTLKNSEILSESMACGQEQLKTSRNQINESYKMPFHSMKNTIKIMIDKLEQTTATMKEAFLNVHRLSMSTVRVFQSSYSWLDVVVKRCNKKLGTPYEHCMKVFQAGIGVVDCKNKLSGYSDFCNMTYLASPICESARPMKTICVLIDYFKELRESAEQVEKMFHVSATFHHSYSYSSNSSRSASQVAAGIVTEIRSRADPLLTWLSWSSCVTSLFLVLVIFRAKYYQHMYEIRSRFDNRYVTKYLQDLNLERSRQGKETILPLNRREKAKYVTTTSFRLVASEKLYLTRSAVFMAMTTFKLLIHMVADYSLYWVLMTIRYHGRFQSPLQRPPDGGLQVTGDGPIAIILRAIVDALRTPLGTPAPSPVPCLPNPYPPDFQRYTQIGVLIFLIWFFALFEPYGLRLRHIIMGLYRPKKAKARAVWLFNHILCSRGSFLKYARRKLHREYKYHIEERHTFRNLLENVLPCKWLRYLLGMKKIKPKCLLCDTTENLIDHGTYLTRCDSPDCPGVYCSICHKAIGRLCTICLPPADYGDLSDISFERGSSVENSDVESDYRPLLPPVTCPAQETTPEADDSDSSAEPKCSQNNKRCQRNLKNMQLKKSQDDRRLLNQASISYQIHQGSTTYDYVSETCDKSKIVRKSYQKQRLFKLNFRNK